MAYLVQKINPASLSIVLIIIRRVIRNIVIITDPLFYIVNMR